jgi:hypothetical protein
MDTTSFESTALGYLVRASRAAGPETMITVANAPGTPGEDTLSEIFDIEGRLQRNPYGMVAGALAVGFVLGGGLFTRIEQDQFGLLVRISEVVEGVLAVGCRDRREPLLVEDPDLRGRVARVSSGSAMVSDDREKLVEIVRFAHDGLCNPHQFRRKGGRKHERRHRGAEEVSGTREEFVAVHFAHTVAVVTDSRSATCLTDSRRSGASPPPVFSRFSRHKPDTKLC